MWGIVGLTSHYFVKAIVIPNILEGCYDYESYGQAATNDMSHENSSRLQRKNEEMEANLNFCSGVIVCIEDFIATWTHNSSI